MSMLRRLDELIERARKLSDRSRPTLTGELEELRNQARYSLEQVGPAGQDALREISQLRFHPPPDQFDQEPEQIRKHYENFDNLIVLLEKVRNRIETKGLAAHPPVPPFPTPPNSTWRDLSVRFLSDHRMEIRIGDQVETRNYAEAGFEDRRSEKPDSAWQLLCILAEKGGTISKPEQSGAAKWTGVEKRVQQIRKLFRKIFRIPGDPFEPFHQVRGYKAKFQISCAESFES